MAQIMEQMETKDRFIRIREDEIARLGKVIEDKDRVIMEVQEQH